MAFPTTIDDFTPHVDNTEDVMATHINELQTAIEALEAKVGANSSIVTTSHDYKIVQLESSRVKNTGNSVDVDLGTHTLTATGIASKAGGLFAGEVSPFPTGYGTYVANYVSSTYGARVLAYNGSAYQDLSIGALFNTTLFPIVAKANGTLALNMGSDATGDILYRNSSGVLTRLAVGTSSQVLIGGTIPAYSSSLPSAITATTQSANDNSTKLATTAYADLKLPKAGGTMTGKITEAGRDTVGAAYTPATGSQTVALDCATNNIHNVTGNASGTAITFTIANATNNQPFIVSILQGSTVSTIAGWFATIRWAGGTAPTLTATANKRDTFGFIRTGTNTYDGFIIGQNC